MKHRNLKEEVCDTLRLLQGSNETEHDSPNFAPKKRGKNKILAKLNTAHIYNQGHHFKLNTVETSCK